MGIRFPDNFNFPYLARNPQDFWRRWHISLSSWIRDYLYLPLCGLKSGDRSTDGLAVAASGERRIGRPRRIRRFCALWITWLLMGLWHGANWTFVLWGLWHAAVIAAYRMWASLNAPKMPGVVAWAFTLPIVMLGWIPFRAGSVDQTISLYARLIDIHAWVSPPEHGPGLPLWLALHRNSYYAAVAIIGLIVVARVYVGWIDPWLTARPLWRLAADGVVAAVAAPLILLFLQPVQQFIYFQF